MSRRWERGAAMAIMAVGFATWGDERTALERIAEALPHVTMKHIVETPADDVFEIEISESNAFLYVTADGRFVFTGDMYDLSSDQIVNLTEVRREEKRRRILEGINPNEAIVYKPTSGDEPKIVVYVFTDVDCPYCREFHGNVGELNQLGV